MSAFKQLLNQDAYVSTYIAKKSFNLDGFSLPTNKIYAFPWELLPCDLSVICQYLLDPTPTPTSTVTATITPTNSVTPSVTITPSNTSSPTPTRSITPSVSFTPSPSITKTPSVTRTVTKTPSRTATPTRTVTPTGTVTPSVTQTPIPCITLDSLYLRLDAGWYSGFNEETDVWTDLSGNGNNAVRTGSRVTYNESNYGFDFTGTGTSTTDGIYIKNLNYVSGFSDPIPNLTIEAWVKPTSGTTSHDNDERIILSFDDSAVLRFGIGYSGSAAAVGKPHFSFTTSDGIYKINADGFGGNLNDDDWHQVVVTFASSGVKFYVNSVLVSETTGSYAPIGGQFDIETPRYGWIGNGSEATTEAGDINPGNMFYGSISVVHMYYKTLSQSEISYNFSCLSPRFGIIALTPTPTRSVTPSSTPSDTPSKTPTPSTTITRTPTPSTTVTRTPTPSTTITRTPTPSTTITRTPTPSTTYTVSNTPSTTFTRTPTPSTTFTRTPTPSTTVSRTPTTTNTMTPSITVTPSIFPEIFGPPPQLWPDKTMVLRFDANYPDSYNASTNTWKELSGTGYDSIRTGNSITFGSEANSLTGGTIKFFSFNGLASSLNQGIYIKTLRYISGLTDSISNLTITAWIKAASTSTSHQYDQRTILSFDETSVFTFGIGNATSSGTAGKLSFVWSNTDGEATLFNTFHASAGPDLRDNTWHQVAVTFSPTEIVMYMDGYEIGNKTGTFAPIGNHLDTETPRYGYIGNRSAATTEGGGTGTDFLFHGYIGAINMYYNTFTSEEIDANFDAMRAYFGVVEPTPSPTNTNTPTPTPSSTPGTSPTNTPTPSPSGEPLTLTLTGLYYSATSPTTACNDTGQPGGFYVDDPDGNVCNATMIRLTSSPTSKPAATGWYVWEDPDNSNQRSWVSWNASTLTLSSCTTC